MRVHLLPKDWIDEAGWQLLLRVVWEKRPGGLLRKPSFLVRDQLRDFRSESIKKKVAEIKTGIAVIPGGLTKQLQPLDMSLNRLFKQNMKEQWNTWTEMLDTLTGRIKITCIAQVCKRVKQTWDDIKLEIVVKSFKMYGINNVLNGTEDDTLFNDDNRRIENEYQF